MATTVQDILMLFEKAEKERIEREKEREKERIEREKEREKERIEREKVLEKERIELEKERNEREKILEKERIEREKVLEKERIEREKEREKVRNEREKVREKERSEREKERQEEIRVINLRHKKYLRRLKTQKELREIERVKAEIRREELDKAIKEMSASIKKAEDLFTTQWGKLVEALVQGPCLNLFKKIGIDVSISFDNVYKVLGDKRYEFDVVLGNGTEMVVIEAKTTLRISDVKDFLNKMEIVRQILTPFPNQKMYGAVAGIKVQENVKQFAMNNGLFVLKLTGEGLLEMMNQQNFKPKQY